MSGIGSWESLAPPELLAIATPYTGEVRYEWALAFKFLQPPIAFNVICNRGLPIDRARDELVKQAKIMNASHIFFLDSDVILPNDGLIKLWNWRLPIVCGVYGSKHNTVGVWVELSKSGDTRYAAIMPEELSKGRLWSHPNMVVGAGCLLIDMQVFNRLKEPWFYWTQGREPSGLSEDFYFFEKCREIGIPIHVDTEVKCSHIETCSLDWTGKRQRLVL